MYVSTQSIYDALRRTDGDIEKQILELRTMAGNMGVDVHKLQDKNGAYVLTPLLLAKASVLSGIATIKAAELNRQKT